MRLVLDACVLYPSITRSLLLAAAKAGFFEPIWSDRLLEEWRRAGLRRGDIIAAACAGEIALLRAAWPNALRKQSLDLRRFWLPDENDIHVLALAVEASADGIVTYNAKDFPRNILSDYGLARHDPDLLLRGFHTDAPQKLEGAVAPIIKQACADLDGFDTRKLLKKAKLPRLGKILEG